MQVIVALADAGGDVVSREKLLLECWNGVVVGDDSLNRAIAGARRALEGSGASAGIETIPRVGYRLAGIEPTTQQGRSRFSRRAIAVGAGAATCLSAGVGWLIFKNPRRDSAVQQLVDRGRQALRDDYPDSAEQGAGFLREAVALAPGDAEAWGLLALALRNIAEYAPLEQIDAATAACQDAARRALALDPDQPHAMAALALLPPIHGDWFAAEQRMRKVLERHPDQIETLAALAVLLISVGRITDGARANARAAALEPLSPVYQFRRAYHQWYLGDIPAADLTIDRATQLWPRHPAVWYAKLLIRGLTGREQTALHMIENDRQAALALPPPGLRQWRATMTARLTSAPNLRAQAIEANLESVRRILPTSVNAVLLLSSLNAIDEAFWVTDAYLFGGGPLLTAAAARAPFINDQRWKKTMMLFTPTTAPMRADARFRQLARDAGLEPYWRQSGRGPDYLR